MPSGGAGRGQGRKPRVKPQEIAGPLVAPSVAEKRNICQLVIEALDDPTFKHCPADSPTKCMRCMLVDDCREMTATGATTRRWTVEGAQGKAVHHVNHMHDKPIEMNINLNLGQRLAAARKRALGK